MRLDGEKDVTIVACDLRAADHPYDFKFGRVFVSDRDTLPEVKRPVDIDLDRDLPGAGPAFDAVQHRYTVSLRLRPHREGRRGDNLAMPIDRERLEDHISRRGPLMFHVTAAAAVPAIRADGLRPGSELGVSSKGGFFKTRQGRVYLGDALSLALVEVEGNRAYLGVDLRGLDPELIDPDEDQVQGSFDPAGAGWVAQPPPINSYDTDT